MMYNGQYNHPEISPLTIPIHDKMGFDKYADVDPVMAKTTRMTKACQLDVMFQRCLKFVIMQFVVQI